MSLHKTYLSASSLALFSKGFNIAATFLILWLQNAVLGKEDFGLFMLAFALTFTVSLVAAAPFKSLVLYHVSRKADVNIAEGASIAGQAFWLSLATGLMMAALVFILAEPLAGLTGHPGLAGWLHGMAFFIPVSMGVIVLPDYARGQRKIKETLFFQEIFLNFLRAAFLAAIWAWGLPQGWVAGAYILSALISVLCLFALMPVWPSFNRSPITARDWAYGFKSMGFQILNQPFRGLDIVMVGAFASASIVADYAMATRLSQLLWVPKHALAQLQVPRMGLLLGKNDKAQLALEYDAMRCLSLLAVLAGCAFLCWFGKPVLSLFGNYESALPALYILSAAALIRTGYGAAGDLLSMLAFPKGSALVSLGSVIITLGGIALLTPFYGAAGAGFAVLAGTVQMFAGFVFVIERSENVKFMPALMMMLTYLPALVLMALFAHIIPAYAAGIVMAVAMLLLMVCDRSYMTFFVNARKGILP